MRGNKQHFQKLENSSTTNFCDTCIYIYIRAREIVGFAGSGLILKLKTDLFLDKKLKIGL